MHWVEEETSTLLDAVVCTRKCKNHLHFGVIYILMKLLLYTLAVFFCIAYTIMTFATAPGGLGRAGRAFGPTIILPAVRHTATLIMLHGLGDTGNGWAPVAPELNLNHVKWVFPTAPTRPITVNYGSKMPGWFDIDHLDEEAFRAMMNGHKGFDPEGTNEAISYVTDLIAKEVESGIPANRIVVGGFSQGGHIALRTALQHPVKLAGCAALSTWLEPSPFEIPAANLNLPIFYGHGTFDPLIPAPIAQASNKVLEGRGIANVEFKMYPGMGHSSCPQELQDLKKFLLKTLPDTPVTKATPSKEDVEKMSTRELKSFLQENGETTAGLLEKRDRKSVV